MYVPKCDRLWEKVQLRAIDNSVIQAKKQPRVKKMYFEFLQSITLILPLGSTIPLGSSRARPLKKSISDKLKERAEVQFLHNNRWARSCREKLQIILSPHISQTVVNKWPILSMQNLTNRRTQGVKQ